jgi:homoserine dehydrogenase
MTINIALLGFGTVASGIPFLLKENGEKITAQAGTEIQIAKVLVRDDAEKQGLLAQGHQYEFVTDITAILNDDTIDIVIELMGRIEPAKTFITQALQAKNTL